MRLLPYYKPVFICQSCKIEHEEWPENKCCEEEWDAEA